MKSNPAAFATESRPVSDGEPQGGRPTTGNLSADQRPGAALLIVLGTLLGASLIFLAVYHFRTYRTGFHSDGAYRNILAAEMLRTGQVFPAHFVFVNDIPIFFGHIFIVLLGLLGANPSTYFMNALSGFIDSLLLLATVAFFFQTAGTSLVSKLLGLALIMSGFSVRLLEIIYGQNAYGPFAIEMLLALTLAYRVLFGSDQRYWRGVPLSAAYFGGLIAVMSMDGPRGFMSVTVPLSLTVGCMALMECRNIPELRGYGRRVAVLAVCCLLATTVGTAVFLYARGHTAYTPQFVAQTFSTVDEISAHIGLFLSGSLDYFGALPIAGRIPYSVYGLVTAYRLALAILFMSLPFLLLYRYKALQCRFLRFALLFYLINFVCLLYYYIFGHVAQDINSYRYFANNLVLLIVIVAMSIDEIRVHTWRREFVTAVVVAALLPALLSAYAVTSYDVFHEIPRTAPGDAPRPLNSHDPLTRALVAHGLRYGYATFWHAAVITVLSNGASQVRQLYITSDGKFLPFHHLASNDWYRPDYYRGPTFLIVADDESPRVDQLFLEQLCGLPRETIRVPGFSVLVFSFNVASRLPGWN